MQKDERDLLEVLKFELDFVQKGGYNPSPRDPRKMNFIFEDSPTCMNYDSKDNPGPCNECVLMGLVPPDQRGQTIPCRHIPLDASGQTLESLYRQSGPREIGEVYEKWLRATIAKLTADRESRGTPAPQSAPGAPIAIGEPLFGKLHPKCANPACSAAFHWLAGGRFERFQTGELTDSNKTTVAETSDSSAPAKHYWLCESCVQAYTLNFREDTGVTVEARWPEFPVAESPKQLSAANR